MSQPRLNALVVDEKMFRHLVVLEMPKAMRLQYPISVLTIVRADGTGESLAGIVRRLVRAADLVEIVKLDPTIHLDVRYATSNNFTGRSVYRQARAFLQRPAAEALVRVNRSLHEKGYGLLVFDGYRPWSVTKLFWDITAPDKREKGFVANPAKGSKHNRGAAVDLSMYDLSTGRQADMPSTYDEFSDRASPDYKGGTDNERARRDRTRSHKSASKVGPSAS